jgi:dihydroorotase
VADLVLKGGTVFGPEGAVAADVAVSGTQVRAVEPGIDAENAIDVTGCWVGPGLVDLHSHLRQPGQEWKEDIASGSSAAAAGGFTALVAMPNTDPPIDSGHLARYVAERGFNGGLAEVMPAGCITLGRRGEALAHLDELWEAGVRIFTDDGDTVSDAGLLRRAMEYLSSLTTDDDAVVVAQHAEDAGLARGGHMHEGSVSSRLGMRGIPALAEEVVVSRDLALVQLTGCRYHCQHISTAATVELIRNAKRAALPVTAEVTPHHLTLDHGAVLSMDPRYKMYPPLRTAEDAAALREALADGTIDAVATDHAPHASHETEVPFEEAPRGVIGLETAAAVVLTATDLDPVTFFERMAVAPARIAGLAEHGRWVEPGAPANLVVFDPESRWTVDRFKSKARNSPFIGTELRGRVLATVFNGRVTFQTERALR